MGSGELPRALAKKLGAAGWPESCIPYQADRQIPGKREVSLIEFPIPYTHTHTCTCIHTRTHTCTCTFPSLLLSERGWEAGAGVGSDHLWPKNHKHRGGGAKRRKEFKFLKALWSHHSSPRPTTSAFLLRRTHNPTADSTFLPLTVSSVHPEPNSGLVKETTVPKFVCTLESP